MSPARADGLGPALARPSWRRRAGPTDPGRFGAAPGPEQGSLRAVAEARSKAQSPVRRLTPTGRHGIRPALPPAVRSGTKPASAGPADARGTGSRARAARARPAPAPPGPAAFRPRSAPPARRRAARRAARSPPARTRRLESRPRRRRATARLRRSARRVPDLVVPPPAAIGPRRSAARIAAHRAPRARLSGRSPRQS